MADSRFFARAGPFRLRELAELVGAELSAGADPDTEISDLRQGIDPSPGGVGQDRQGDR